MEKYDPRYSADEGGERIEEMVLNIDLAPTILSMGGVDIPSQMQGKDLLRLIEGDPKSWRTEFYYEHTLDIPTIPKSIGVISEDYTYLRYPELESGFEEFYDLSSDSLQINNLIGEEECSDLIEDFRNRTEEWKRKVK